MRVLFVASEASPLVKVGGLADVVGSLPRALNGLGHDVRVMMPRYGDLAAGSISKVMSNLSVPVPSGAETFTLKQSTIRNGVRVYFIESRRYFGDARIYTETDLERFLFFSRAAVDVIARLGWQPQVVHCHDWHSALAAMWLSGFTLPYPTMFTIHNLAYQGPFDHHFMRYAGLEEYWRNIPRGAPPLPLAFMSQGILRAGLVSTVSETYAREIMTAEQGMGLDALLRYRSADLLGIINGIDYQDYNPETDTSLAASFDTDTIEKRFANKLALQRQSGFAEQAEVPLIGMVQRLDEQKGLDIFGKAAPRLFEETPAQIVVLGGGRQKYVELLRETAARYPRRMALFTAFNDPLARLIYGGCDMFLMPSRFEPCGLGQMIAMRYGALPVVRHTGGLVDTVPPLNADLSEGNGFVFRDYTPEALVDAVKQAIAAFADKAAWRRAAQRVMKLDFSWGASALKYEAAYRRALKTR